MPLANRNNSYDFDGFLNLRNNFDYYTDDPFLQKVVRYFAASEWNLVDEEARKFSQKASFRWKEVTENISRPENHPRLIHFNAHNQRIDRLVRPYELVEMENEILAQALFSKKTLPWVRMVKQYLIFQNGEACLMCPLACTEGLIVLLEKFADTSELKQILAHCKEGIEGDYALGAQFLSEIQGGSDIPGNLVEAVREDDIWKIYGKKFFCSAAHVDYAVVTAKPTGSESVAIFVVPSWLPGNKKKEIRNGYTIDRIKWKMGTSELPTAEITFRGAIAYQVGPLEQGLTNVIGLVLSRSRLMIGLSTAASMTKAAREAKQYSEFREAFGRKIKDYPMVYHQISSMESIAQQTTAAIFKICNEFLSINGDLAGGLNRNESLEMKRKRFEIRELIMLQKITASWDATDVIRQAMSIFGGHGVMEDFSSLPRLYRDSAVHELWEGPRNVLLAQIHRDFQKASQWYPPSDFVNSILKGREGQNTKKLATEMTELVAYPNLTDFHDKTREICERWTHFCHKLFHAYQEMAWYEVNSKLGS